MNNSSHRTQSLRARTKNTSAAGSPLTAELTARTWIERLYARVLTVLTYRLQTLMESLDPVGMTSRMMHILAAPARTASLETMRAHRACARSILTLRVLVQNRRKDKTPILVFASQSQVLSLPSSTAAVQRGAGQHEYNGIATFNLDK